MWYAAAALVIAIASVFAHLRGTAKREIEFRKAFNIKCMEADRENQDQR